MEGTGSYVPTPKEAQRRTEEKRKERVDDYLTAVKFYLVGEIPDDSERKGWNTSNLYMMGNNAARELFQPVAIGKLSEGVLLKVGSMGLGERKKIVDDYCEGIRVLQRVKVMPSSSEQSAVLGRLESIQKNFLGGVKIIELPSVPRSDRG